MPVRDEVYFNYDAAQNQGIRPMDIQAETAVYKMPKVQQGDCVNWYQNGNVRQRPLIAFVQLVTNGNIDLYIPGSQYQFAEGVLHVSDPRLRLGREHGNQGAWDFTENDKVQRAWKAQVEKDIMELKATVSGSVTLEQPSADISAITKRLDTIEASIGPRPVGRPRKNVDAPDGE